MQLSSYGKKQNFIAIKEDKKNTKVHLVFLNPRGKPHESTVCYLKWFREDDIVDEINSMLDLKGILHDDNFCKTCLKIFNEVFHKYYEELKLREMFARNREKRYQKNEAV